MAGIKRVGRFGRFHEMREGGPKGSGIENNIFKCVDCSAETHHPDGWNGEPSEHRCGPNCPSHGSDWRPGNKQIRFNQNFDRIFPKAPGAGI